MAADHLGELIDILEAHGVGGQGLRDLADKVNGERDPETGLRGKGAAKADDAEEKPKTPAKS